nr:MAG TPA: hypothetical protein [Caudoviricetes sp.]
MSPQIFFPLSNRRKLTKGGAHASLPQNIYRKPSNKSPR